MSEQAKAPQPKPRDTTPIKLYQHFVSEPEKEQFLRDVKQDQKDGTVPF